MGTAMYSRFILRSQIISAVSDVENLGRCRLDGEREVLP